MLNILLQLLRCMAAVLSNTSGASRGLCRVAAGMLASKGIAVDLTADLRAGMRWTASRAAEGLSGEEKRIFMDMVSTGDQ